MPELLCRHRLPSPAVAGYCDIVDRETGEVLKLALDVLKEEAKKYPGLRPCIRHETPGGHWNWIERENCKRCPEAVER